MAQTIDNAMQDEWRTKAASRCPDQGSRDRKILFAAIAQGVLNYLERSWRRLIRHESRATAG